MRLFKFSAISGLLVTFCLLSAARPAMAVGLGELELQSRLGEPLQARIKVTRVDGMSLEQLKVLMASRQAYAQRGLERGGIHSQIALEMERDAKGATWVKISTPRPVNEPMLPLVIEVRWPSGTLSRDFAVMLDPP